MFFFRIIAVFALFLLVKIPYNCFMETSIARTVFFNIVCIFIPYLGDKRVFILGLVEYPAVLTVDHLPVGVRLLRPSFLILLTQSHNLGAYS